MGHTFAEITASVDEMFLDDETSPTDSLVSSTDSDEIISKRNKKKINDAIKGLVVDCEDDAAAARDSSGSPLLMSPCSPTHASHSLSLSDEGRDFLIDDEIADQPALCFSKSHGKLTEFCTRLKAHINYVFSSHRNRRFHATFALAHRHTDADRDGHQQPSLGRRTVQMHTEERSR